MSPAPVPRSRPAALTLVALAAVAVAGAVLPVLAGLAFLVSLATHRPLVATAARRWPWLSGRPGGHQPKQDRRVVNGLTAVWGIAMLAAVVWLGEPLSVSKIIGAAAVLLGVALTRTPEG